MRALGRALAEWLLDRRVRTDITQAPVKAWLEGSQRPAAQPSLFASLVPGLTSDAPPTLHPEAARDVAPILDLLREGIPATQVSIDHLRGRGATTVGRRRVEGPVSGAAKTLQRVPRWVWFSVPAGIALLSAVVASFTGGSAEERPVPAPVAAAAPPKAPEPAPVAAKPPEQPLPVAKAPPAATQAQAPEVQAPKSTRVASPRPAMRRQPSRSELKNPFN
jgi:hypothetical protein